MENRPIEKLLELRAQAQKIARYWTVTHSELHALRCEDESDFDFVQVCRPIVTDIQYELPYQPLGDGLQGISFAGSTFVRADLGRANFTYCDLRGCDFTLTRLDGINLTHALGIVSFQGIGSEHRTAYAWRNRNKIIIRAGCFEGDVDELIKTLEIRGLHNIHYADKGQYRRDYEAFIEFAERKLL